MISRSPHTADDELCSPWISVDQISSLAELCMCVCVLHIPLLSSPPPSSPLSLTHTLQYTQPFALTADSLAPQPRLAGAGPVMSPIHSAVQLVPAGRSPRQRRRQSHNDFQLDTHGALITSTLYRPGEESMGREEHGKRGGRRELSTPFPDPARPAHLHSCKFNLCQSS